MAKYDAALNSFSVESKIRRALRWRARPARGRAHLTVQAATSSREHSQKAMLDTTDALIGEARKQIARASPSDPIRRPRGWIDEMLRAMAARAGVRPARSSTSAQIEPGANSCVSIRRTRGGGRARRVIEFFYYGCPVCYETEPFLSRWLGSALTTSLCAGAALRARPGPSPSCSTRSRASADRAAALALYDNVHFEDVKPTTRRSWPTGRAQRHRAGNVRPDLRFEIGRGQGRAGARPPEILRCARVPTSSSTASSSLRPASGGHPASRARARPTGQLAREERLR